MEPTPVFLSGESRGQRSLVGYSLKGCKESNMAEVTKHTCIRLKEIPYKTGTTHLQQL